MAIPPLRFRHFPQKGQQPLPILPEKRILHDHQAELSHPGMQDLNPPFQQDDVVDPQPIGFPHGLGQPARFRVHDQDRFEVFRPITSASTVVMNSS